MFPTTRWHANLNPLISYQARPPFDPMTNSNQIKLKKNQVHRPHLIIHDLKKYGAILILPLVCNSADAENRHSGVGTIKVFGNL